MKVSVITDELSSDLDTALELALEYGFDGVELRGIGDSRYPRVTPLMKRRTPELVAEYGLPVASISPGLFKIPLPEKVPPEAAALRWDEVMSFEDERAGEERLALHLERLLPDSIAAACAVGSPIINCFSFNRGTEPMDSPIPDQVIDCLKHACRLAATKGLSLSIENEVTCWGADSITTADLIRRVGEPNIGITWDPANAFRAGEDRPFPDGYRRIRDLVRHVHFKNARIIRDTGRRGFDFDGVVDWAGQLKALGEDGYSGFVSVETHQRPKLATTRRYLELARTLSGGASRKRSA